MIFIDDSCVISFPGFASWLRASNGSQLFILVFSFSRAGDRPGTCEPMAIGSIKLCRKTRSVASCVLIDSPSRHGYQRSDKNEKHAHTHAHTLKKKRKEGTTTVGANATSSKQKQKQTNKKRFQFVFDCARPVRESQSSRLADGLDGNGRHGYRDSREHGMLIKTESSSVNMIIAAINSPATMAEHES